MPGIEIAGVALAIFPLVLKGLKSFSDGTDQFKRWRTYRRELSNYAREISTQRVIYLATLEQLLDGVVLSDSDFASMLVDPRSEVWKKPEHERRLKKRLDYRFEPYLETTRFLVETLEQLREKLGIGPTGTVCDGIKMFKNVHSNLSGSEVGLLPFSTL